MRRRAFGVAGLQRSAQRSEQLKSLGNQLAAAQLKQLQEQMAQFKSSLESFAQKHRKAILKDPEFRARFQQMCAMIGVDPLASSRGFWGDILGVGDFYYELGVQILEQCLARGNAGDAGLISLDSLCGKLRDTRLKQSNGESQAITPQDVERSIDMLGPLGRNAIRIVRLFGRNFVTTQASGISATSARVFNYIVEMCDRNHNGPTALAVSNVLGLSIELSEMYLLLLVDEGRIWIDTQTSEMEPSPVDTFRYFALPVSAESSLCMNFA